jgi:hypothetical protein
MVPCERHTGIHIDINYYYSVMMSELTSLIKIITFLHRALQ